MRVRGLRPRTFTREAGVPRPARKRSFRSAAGRYQLLSRVVSGGGAMRMRASTTTQPSDLAMTGFKSSSATSGSSSTRRATRNTTSARAGMSEGGAPRNPLKRTPALPPRTSSSASTSVKGARRKPASPMSSASVPPGPSATSGPNTGSWTAPTRISAPPRRNGCTRTGRPIRVTASSTASESRRSSATPPCSVLCAPAAAVFTTTG